MSKAPERAGTSAEGPWWLRRPSGGAAFATTALCLAFASAGGWLAAQWSPLVARNLIPDSVSGVQEIFLSTLPDDPERVLLVTQRSLATIRRGEAAQAGSHYWIHRYGDPARPGLPDRILLSSRSRGARLLVPIGALDLDSALTALPEADVVGTPDAHKPPRVRTGVVQLYVDRLFAGAYLELRFPDRERDARGDPQRFDLVAIRGNRVRCADFVLTPNPRYYRAELAEGGMPHGEFRVNELPTGPELLFAFHQDLKRPADPLQVPISVFDELGLAWGDVVPTLVDDRWQIERLPRYAKAKADSALRESTARLVAVDLAARIEERSERERLASNLTEWLTR